MASSNDLYKLVGKNIAKVRKECSVTQEQLSIDTNLSMSFISQMEAPNTNKGISLETLFLISQKYKVDIRRFFDDYEELMNPNDK